MPRRDSAPLGAPCWIDLYTSDPDRSGAFYGELFGWTAEAAGDEYGGYITYALGGLPVAGGMTNDGASGQPDTWTVYLASDDAEKTVEASEAAGGQTIVPAMAVPVVGTMAVVADPGGAAIGIWQPEEHKGFGVWAEPDAPAWFELHTRDYDRALEFYRATFGWDTHVQSDSDGFRYTTLGEGEAQAAGVMDASILPDDAPLGWSVYFGVADADATVATIEQLGGSIRIPVEDTPYGRLAEAVDPTGARFKIQQA